MLTRSVWLGEHGLKELFGAPQSLFGEHDGFGLVHWVSDHPLLMEPVQRVPIEPLPRPPTVMETQEKEREHRVVDLVRIERHPRILPPLSNVRGGLRRMRTAKTMARNALLRVEGISQTS